MSDIIKYACDFETSVYDGQSETEVWAAAYVEVGDENVTVVNNIDAFFKHFERMRGNKRLYFHNLKFDGAFILDYYLLRRKFKQGIYRYRNEKGGLCERFRDDTKLQIGEINYSISAMGQWYKICIRTRYGRIEIYDSLKLLPLSVKEIGKAFKTKYQKGEIEYKGERHAGGVITEEEKDYISRDVLVLSEALAMTFDEGHNKMTIGACCMAEYKQGINHNYIYPGYEGYKKLMPNIYTIKIDKELYGAENAGLYVRNAYAGAWCYVPPGKAGKLQRNGKTFDVNSLYPSMMHSESGNKYPVGIPVFWKGEEIPPEAKREDTFYFIRVSMRFRLKSGKLPFLHVRRSYLYDSTENLASSEIEGIGDFNLIFTFTEMDWGLVREHYDLYDLEILDGCFFPALVGIFDDYINKYREIKMTSKGGKRLLAKLYLNNLYGKLATSTNSSFKIAYEKTPGVLGFRTIHEQEKIPGYIPCGAAITSYARNFTIRAAQLNYHGDDKDGFCYADTDSVHMTGSEVEGITEHPTAFCCWKKETEWDFAYFTRQKTYIEHITERDGERVEPYYNITCAGLPVRSKEYMEMSLEAENLKDYNELSEEAKQEIKEAKTFLYDHNGKPIKRNITDFKKGIQIPGKLLPKRIKGGVVLCDSMFEMRK